MKKIFKVLAIITLVAVIGFSFACSGGGDDGSNTGGDDPSPPSWTAVADSTFNGTRSGDSINAITYGNGKFVAGGLSYNELSEVWTAHMAYSMDGATWTAVSDNPFGSQTTSSFPMEINAIAYGNGKFVAVGKYNNMVTSTDLVTWTAVSINNGNGSNDIQAIAYGNGRFVTGRRNPGGVDTLMDDETWLRDAKISTFYDSNSGINAIAYGNGKFVAVGDNGKMAWSTDGTTWTAVADSKFPTDYTGTIRAIAYGNGKFVAGGGYYDGSTSTGKMAYSTDGATWTAVADSKFGTDTINAIAFGNGKFVAGGGVKMAYSTDGATWTAIRQSVFEKSTYYDDDIRAIAYGNGKFVAVGWLGKMAYSTGY